VALLVAALVAGDALWTRPVRGAVQTYYELLSAANHQDVEAARALCTTRFCAGHGLKPAPEGGLAGLPRGIHKNFQVWRHGDAVWLCPSNRVGPVYQFIYERGRWRFDGPIGLLQPGGRVERLTEEEG
jgi:hypothetical protein